MTQYTIFKGQKILKTPDIEDLKKFVGAIFGTAKLALDGCIKLNLSKFELGGREGANFTGNGGGVEFEQTTIDQVESLTDEGVDTGCEVKMILRIYSPRRVSSFDETGFRPRQSRIGGPDSFVVDE